MLAQQARQVARRVNVVLRLDFGKYMRPSRGPPARALQSQVCADLGPAKRLHSLSRPSSDTLIASVVLGCHERNTRHFRRALAAHAHPHRLVCLYLLPHIGVSKLNEHHEETFQDSTDTTYRHLIVIGRASCSIGHSIVVHLWSFVSLDRVSTTGLDLEGMRSA
jgi:hypothetical protein